MSEAEGVMFRFGVDYYPEQWPESRWEKDAQLMAEAGFNVVRLAEFAWVKMEPREGVFDFEWLDRAIQIFHKQNISVVLGTPTASPPAWLVSQYPDALRVFEDGRRAAFGSRRINCPNHPTYRERARMITRAMARHFVNNPAVIGWQIDNEFGDRCFCVNCRREFQAWLRRRYHDLDILNERYGTVFWSQTYIDWSDIPLPMTNLGVPPNPSLALDYRRFMSDSWLAFQQEQVDILRAECPAHFVTHNMMGFEYDGLNYFDIARPLDFVSWDNYPLGFWRMQKYAPSLVALNHDAMRGLKGKNFWVMEQQAGPSGWQTVSHTPRPGELRLWAYQAIAHGADGIVFFRWRTARFGAEQYWHGLLEHDGRLSRRYHEIKAMGAELKQAAELFMGAETKSRVAILHSYDVRFAFQVQANSETFGYEKIIYQIYSALWKYNISVDVVSPLADLSGYDLVIAPALHILTDTVAGRLQEYVRLGGALLVTPRTGVKDEANAVVNQPLPGLLAEVCGVTVAEYDALSQELSQAITFNAGALAGQTLPVQTWCDILEPQSAQVLAHYVHDYYAGRPAVTRNWFGKGQAVYLGAFGDESFYETLFGWLLHEMGIATPLTAPEGVYIRERWRDERPILFVLNFSGEPQQVELPEPYRSLLDDTIVSGAVQLPPNGVFVLSALE